MSLPISQQLLVVTGKGGVGKSAVAAALGELLAAAGRRVLVLEIDPRESVHQLFGLPPSGGEILEIGGNLHLQNLRARQVLDQLVREKLKVPPLVNRVLASPVYQHFTEGAPGLKEMAVLGHALRLVQGKVPKTQRFDLVILDAPATGHGVSLLTAPLLVSEVIEHGPIGRMTAEVAKLVADGDRTAVAVVTQAEEMPATEALELRDVLRDKLGRDPDLLVVNGVYPPLDATARGEGTLARLWRRRRRLNDHELARLTADWPGQRVELPRLPLARGPELVAELAGRLSAAVGGNGGAA